MLVVLACFVVPTPARGDTITFAFQGTFAGFSAALGITGIDTYSGTFVYDPNALPAASGIEDGSAYTLWQSASTAVTVTVNGVTYRSSTPPGYGTYNDRLQGGGTEFPPARYDFMFVEVGFEPGWTSDGYTQMILAFADSSRSMFEPTAWALPTSFAGFDLIDFALNGEMAGGAWGHAEGLVTSFQPIPEPGSLLLLGTGLIGEVRAARRRRG